MRNLSGRWRRREKRNSGPGQICQWLHVKLADSFGEMTNLSMALREKLGRDYEIARVDLVERQISKADPTEKFLFELADGNMVESVLMKYDYAIPCASPPRRLPDGMPGSAPPPSAA